MYCSNCGSQVGDESRFCSSCGAVLNQQPPNSTQPPSENADAPFSQAPKYQETRGSYTQQPIEYRGIPQGQFGAYTQPIQGPVKTRKTPGTKKRTIIMISVAAAVIIIGAIATILLLGSGGGKTSQVSGKVADAEAYISDGETNGLTDALVTVSKDGKNVAKTKTNDNGEYSLKLKEGDYKLTIKYEGYITADFNFKVSGDKDTYLPLTKLLPASDSMGTVSGTVINSLTGEPISGAEIKIRGSSEDSSFDPIDLASDAEGLYTTELPAGYYSADINVIGFSKLTVPLIVIGGQTIDNQNGAMTPILEAGQLRIVLTWGEFPLDLDSHFTGPSPEGKPFHIFYRHKASIYNGETMTGLDLDETTSYGPETTTIYNAVDGTYSFYVHDFSNRDSGNATALANSGALVQVYEGDALVEQFNVPTSLVGTIWHVFDFTAGEITASDSDTADLEMLNSDAYDSGWTRIQGDTIPVGVSVSTDDFTKMGFSENTMLLDLVDRFGLPDNYDSIETLKADMEKGLLYREEEDDNPLIAYWSNGKGITYAKFDSSSWTAKYIGLDPDVLELPYSIQSGMTFDEVISAMQIGSALRDISLLTDRDDIVKYLKDHNIAGKDYEDGYVQAFLIKGAFGYQVYTEAADGFDEVDYYLEFYADKSVFSLSFEDNSLASISISFRMPPTN